MFSTPLKLLCSTSTPSYYSWPRAILPAGGQALPLAVAVAAPAPTLIQISSPNSFITILEYTKSCISDSEC
ncbi:hypothetical protein BDV11DRAFT_192328 [Aspergillus similis]